MPDELKNQSGGGKTPEQELAELLRQSRVKPMGMGPLAPAPRVLAEGLGTPPRKNFPKINWLALLIGAFTLVLVFGTGYFVLSGLRSNTGEITFELNENQTGLKIDGRDYGSVDTGYVARLKAGAHTINLSKAGWLEITSTVEIERGGKILLTFQLLPVPAIEKTIEGDIRFPRLNQDGSEISYFDNTDKTFKSMQLVDKQVVALFRGDFPATSWVAWAPTDQIALVKLTGQHKFELMTDNRNLKGRYVVLGERPAQGKPNYNGVTTWLFDDNRRTPAGWGAVLMNDSIRQIAFGVGGAEVVYIYDTADGEYSLVRALPDGQEWERMIVDMPRLSPNATLEWGNDGQHILINNNDKLLVADLVAKTVTEVATDRLAASHYELSPDGDRLAYIMPNGENARMVIYDLLANQVKAIDKVTVDGRAVFNWLDDNSVIMVAPNKTFVRIDVNTQDKITIPFVGSDVELDISALDYSMIGKLLMLVTDKGIFTMKI